jgi:hypothetical protein
MPSHSLFFDVLRRPPSPLSCLYVQWVPCVRAAASSPTRPRQSFRVRSSFALTLACAGHYLCSRPLGSPRRPCNRQQRPPMLVHLPSTTAAAFINRQFLMSPLPPLMAFKAPSSWRLYPSPACLYKPTHQPCAARHPLRWLNCTWCWCAVPCLARSPSLCRVQPRPMLAACNPLGLLNRAWCCRSRCSCSSLRTLPTAAHAPRRVHAWPAQPPLADRLFVAVLRASDPVLCPLLVSPFIRICTCVLKPWRRQSRCLAPSPIHHAMLELPPLRCVDLTRRALWHQESQRCTSLPRQRRRNSYRRRLLRSARAGSR